MRRHWLCLLITSAMLVSMGACSSPDTQPVEIKKKEGRMPPMPKDAAPPK